MELSKYLNVNYAATFQPQAHFPRLHHDRPGVQRTATLSILLLHPGVVTIDASDAVLITLLTRTDYVCCLGADHESGCVCCHGADHESECMCCHGAVHKSECVYCHSADHKSECICCHGVDHKSECICLSRCRS